MTDLEAILQAIDTLPQHDIEEVQRHVVERQRQLEAAEAKIKDIHAIIENFWEGFSEEEVAQIIEDINSEYIEKNDE
jgi:hypothetical protein